MRILQVATLFSPDGAYGGPTRVAVNQCRALRERGHEVVVAGGVGGYVVPPAEVDGVPARLSPTRRVVPGTGFAGLSAPGVLASLVRMRTRLDVVHVHLARDLITLPALRIAQVMGLPTVAQTHGMIDASGHRLAAPLDRWLTGPALRAAGSVLYLTDTERDALRAAIPGDLALGELPNGVPEAPLMHREESMPEVLFLARLHERKRPELFVEVARDLLAGGLNAVFTVAGPDGGMGPAVAAAAAGTAVRVEGAVEPAKVMERIARASVYVLPSVDEPYPMSVLESMAAGRPVVVTTSCGLADVVNDGGCGVVVDESRDALRRGIARLLDDPGAAEEMGRRGAALATERFGMSAIATRLESIYDEVRGTVALRPGVRS